MFLKNELQSIISGVGQAAKTKAIQTITGYLGNSKITSGDAEETKSLKEQEAEVILSYARKQSILFHSIPEDRYLAEGAEQKVYLEDDGLHVLKFNDGIFYTTWSDYFKSLLLHNYFFPTTSYELIGFYAESNKLYAVVRQPYIIANEPTSAKAVQEFMKVNGFLHRKNHDYYHPTLGIILEDLHDENVLTNAGLLFFIDTVFYLTPKFYE